MRVNFSVTNQLATPSIHAAALANRPPAGQPGRLFVDTDNPSSGIYRDTGTVWENITGGAGASNLQTVTDAGNTTDNNILLTYPDNTLANALVFYNDQLAQEEYLIEKRGTGITTNDSLVIQSRGNISPSTNPVGFLIDGANDVIKSFYTTSYSEVGLKIDFASQNYKFGNLDNVVYGNLEIYDYDTEDYLVSLRSKSLNYDADISIKLIPDEQIKLRVESISNPNVYSAVDFNTGANRLELKNNDLNAIIQAQSTEITNSLNDAGNLTSLALFTILDFANSTAIHKTQYNGNDVGLKIDFANGFVTLGDAANNSVVFDQASGNFFTSIVAGASGITVVATTADVELGDFQGNFNGTTFDVLESTQIIKSKYLGNDIGLKLDFANNIYQIGVTSNITGGGLAINAGARNYSLGDFNELDNATYLNVDDSSQLIKTVNNGNDIGLKLDFVNDQYYLGKFNGLTYIFANVVNDEIYIDSAGYRNFQAAADLTQIGDNNGNGNTTTFGVNDSSQKLVASTNLLVGSSGSASGQHLKIKVGTTDYVIELKNP